MDRSKGKLHRRLRDDEASLTRDVSAYVSGKTKRLMMICTKHTQAEFTEMEKLGYFCDKEKASASVQRFLCFADRDGSKEVGSLRKRKMI